MNEGEEKGGVGGQCSNDLPVTIWSTPCFALFTIADALVANRRVSSVSLN
jgi:hypothetical protein